MTTDELALRDEELSWLMQHERGRWGLINGRIARSADPVSIGTYANLAAIPPAGTLANAASINGEGALYTNSLWSPWPADSLYAPSAWDLYVSFQVVTSTSPGSATVTPRIGSFAASASTAGGVTLGAGSAVTLTASITTNWIYHGRVSVLRAGIPGANALANGAFQLWAKPATAGTGIATIFDTSGFTQASFDSTVASGVVPGMVNTVTTINYSVTQVHWLSLQ
jgi:hypothetical protein